MQSVLGDEARMHLLHFSKPWVHCRRIGRVILLWALIFHSWVYFLKRAIRSFEPGFKLVPSKPSGLRSRLAYILLKEPIFISLAVRWLGWLVALGIIVFQAAPEHNLHNGPWVLVWTAVQLIIMTLYPTFLRGRYFPASWTGNLWFPVLDIGLGVLAVYQTDGRLRLGLRFPGSLPVGHPFFGHRLRTGSAA